MEITETVQDLSGTGRDLSEETQDVAETDSGIAEASESIYGGQTKVLPQVMQLFAEQIETFDRETFEKTGSHVYEHLNYRIKEEQSMREKCRRQELPESAQSALRTIHDAIGFRIVCLFREDVDRCVEFLRNLSGCQVELEKDYIRQAKPNGYRSYHMILLFTAPFSDVDGENPGRFYVEVQLRTIAMDAWAALEHEIKYKHDIKNPELIVRELKRCAEELAACDVSMQTLRNLVNRDI